MDTSETYIKMSVKAWIDLSEHLGDKISWRSHGYCVKHNCLLLEDQDGGTDCPKWGKLRIKVREKSGFEAEDKLYKRDGLCHYEHWIGLPHQDQLQEMIGIQDVRELLLPFHRFTHPADGMTIRGEDFEDVKARTRYRSLFTTMEQLWLAFVMKEKYNKIWNGSNWVSNIT